MENKPISEIIRQNLALVWHWAWLLILVTVVAGAAAYAINKRTTPVYQASSTILVNEAPANKSADYNSVLTSNLLTQTYSQMMIKEPVLQDVINALQLNVSTSELAKMITADPVRDTQLIVVKVEDTDPQRAADIANKLGEVFIKRNNAIETDRYAIAKTSLEDQLTVQTELITTTLKTIGSLGSSSSELAQRDQLRTSLAQYQQNYNNLMISKQQVLLAIANSSSSIVTIEPAKAPLIPIRPRTALNTSMSALLALLVSTAVILVVDAMDDTLRSPEDVTKLLGMPLLGIIARHQSPEGMLITSAEPRSPVSEAFRSLRTNIQFASVDHPLHTLLVTSPSPEDGKSTVSSNLAVTQAQNGRKVILLEADLRRPKVHKMLNIPNRQGTSGLFVDQEINLNGQVQSTEIPDLYAITAGVLPPNPAELLGSEKMATILKKVSETADMVILDSPPIMAVTDSSVLATRVDGVLLVMQPGKTKLAAGKQAIDQLKRVGANVIGVVVNNVDISPRNYKYAYYRGYYYTYHKYYGDSSSKTHSQGKEGKGKKILGLFGSKN